MNEFQALLTYPGIALSTLYRLETVYLRENQKDCPLDLSQYFGQLLWMECHDRYHDIEGYLRRTEEYGDFSPLLVPIPQGRLESLWIGKLAPSWTGVPIVETLAPIMARGSAFPVSARSLLQACRDISEEGSRHIGGIKFYLGNDWVSRKIKSRYEEVAEVRDRLPKVLDQIGAPDYRWNSDEAS